MMGERISVAVAVRPIDEERKESKRTTDFME